MIVSRNAAPITGVSLSWPTFVTIPFTGTFLAVKGSIKHGWVDGERVVSDPFLHLKSLYFRFGGDSWPIHGWAGIQHAVVWGGTHADPEIGRLPGSFNDFLRVLLVRGAPAGSTIGGERSNVLGNSLGIYDFGIWFDAPSFRTEIYRQFFHEDTVSLRFRSPWDGLWGFNIAARDRRLLEEVLYEHVNTKRQGSRAFERNGTDNYYNHFLYANGWTHHSRTLGIPVILARANNPGVFNNILLAHHLGLSGSLPADLRYRLRVTYTRNYGAWSLFQSIEEGFIRENARYESARHQWYTGLELFRRLSGSRVEMFLRAGYDWGDVFKNQRAGFTVGVQRK